MRHLYQFLQIPHSNKALGLCCIETLCDKAELTSLLIKVTLKKKKKKTLYNSYLFCSCVFGCSLPPPILVWGLFSWLNCSVAQGRVNFWECSPSGLKVKGCVKNARMEKEMIFVLIMTYESLCFVENLFPQGKKKNYIYIYNLFCETGSYFSL